MTTWAKTTPPPRTRTPTRPSVTARSTELAVRRCPNPELAMATPADGRRSRRPAVHLLLLDTRAVRRPRAPVRHRRAHHHPGEAPEWARFRAFPDGGSRGVSAVTRTIQHGASPRHGYADRDGHKALAVCPRSSEEARTSSSDAVAPRPRHLNALICAFRAVLPAPHLMPRA